MPLYIELLISNQIPSNHLKPILTLNPNFVFYDIRKITICNISLYINLFKLLQPHLLNIYLYFRFD